MKEYDKAKLAAEYIQENTDLRPNIGIVLGSGLGDLCDVMQNVTVLPYADIPHMPISLAPGHEGRLYVGEIDGIQIMAFKGRFHYYEGYSMEEVAFPVRVMKLCGVEILITTNAAGGLNPDYYPGCFVVYRDHINLMPANPLRGHNDERFGERFPDMLDVYDPMLIKLAHDAADETNTQLFEGVFVAFTGPNFETKSELRMLRALGGDIIGWSSVPEVLAARHMNMRIMGLTLVSDMSVPDTLENVDAQKVLDVAKQAVPEFVALMRAIFKKIK